MSENLVNPTVRPTSPTGSSNASDEMDEPNSPILVYPSQEIHLANSEMANESEMMMTAEAVTAAVSAFAPEEEFEEENGVKGGEEKEERSQESEKSTDTVERQTLAFFCEWKNCRSNSFDDLTRFLAHLRIHCREIQDSIFDDETPFNCLWCECNEEFASSQLEEFFLHLSYHGYHSKLMSIGVFELNQLVKRLGRPVQCNLDGSSRTLLPGLPDSFVCGWEKCLTSFRDAESYYRHVERHPFEDITIPALSKEVLKKTRFATCLWTECKSAFTSRSRLRDHLRSHTQEKSFACPNCGSLFFNRTKFYDHFYRQMYNEEGNQEKLETYLLHVSLPDDERLTLTLVSQVSPKSTRSEAKGKDGEELSTDSSRNDQEKEQGSFPTLPFSCSYCDKRLPTASLLQEHMRSHKTNWKCNICGYKTNSDSSLTHHISYRHSDLRPFPCQFCDSKFKSRSDLRKHIDTHSDEHPYKCPLCSFKCRCCHTLAKHRKREHESVELVYQCHICLKNFTRGNNLSRHLNKAHKLKIPEGKARFTYKRNDDSIYRLDLSV